MRPGNPGPFRLALSLRSSTRRESHVVPMQRTAAEADLLFEAVALHQGSEPGFFAEAVEVHHPVHGAMLVADADAIAAGWRFSRNGSLDQSSQHFLVARVGGDTKKLRAIHELPGS